MGSSVQLSNVPISYWSMKGICLLVSALGNPLGFDRRMLENLEANTPISDALVCIEMSVVSSRPSVIFASLDRTHSSTTRVLVSYLTTFKACECCHVTK